MRGSILVAPALLGLAATAPTPHGGPSLSDVGKLVKGTIEDLGFFTVHNKAGAHKAKSAAAAMRQSFNKYGWKVPTTAPETHSDLADDDDADDADDEEEAPVAAPAPAPAAGSGSGSVKTSQLLAAPNSNGQTGQVEANSNGIGDVEYLSPVVVGGQKLMMNFDTGSSDFWVFSTKLPSSSTAGHTLYDPSKSKTWKQSIGSKFAVNYGDKSSVSGSTVGTDIVEIGGASASQTIELADVVSNNFVSDTASNGLVGLGFGNLNTVTPNKSKTFIETIKDMLAKPVFTANLKRNAPGTYTFGRIDESQYKNDLIWTPATNVGGHWGFVSPSYAIGDMNSMKANPSNHYAIADTGTSLLLMDDVVVNDYYSQVQGAHYDSSSAGWIYPCSSHLPDLHIAIGPKYANTVPGSVLTFVNVTNNNCFGALQSNGGGNLQILGDVLFKAQFVAFDIGNMQIGFADHA